MRPPGEISTALLQAAGSLTREVDGERRGATLREMAHAAQVGVHAARATVQNLCRAGKLEPVAERPVDYRNRPVTEYAPVQPDDDEDDDKSYWDVASVVSIWARG